MDSDYFFGIFKLFLQQTMEYIKNNSKFSVDNVYNV